MVAIIDGCPAGMYLSVTDIQPALDRRRPGQSRHVSGRQEPDLVRIFSGVFEGKTTGTPITLMIDNCDGKSRDYDPIKEVYRPGHADYTYAKKYGHRDYRGGGRASARETLLRVAAGAIAIKFLEEQHGIVIQAGVTSIGDVNATKIDFDVVPDNAFHFVDETKLPELESLLDCVRKQGDSVGAALRVVATGVPAGLGEPVFQKCDACIAAAMMGIPAVKGVSIGDGFAVVSQMGSEHRDAMDVTGFLSNHAGGILGGISTGETIICDVAFKPTSSIRMPIETQNTAGDVVTLSVTGRHDPCVGIRAVDIVRAMMALVLMDLMQTNRGDRNEL